MKFKITNPRLDEGSKLTAFYGQQYQPSYILTDESFRRWWLHDNPAYGGQDYSIKVAVNAGEIIGHCAYVPVSLWSGGRSYRAAWGGNFIVGERWRGQGVGRALHQAIYDEFDVFLDVGANDTAQTVLHKFGWVNFGPLGRAVAPLNQAAAVFSRAPERVAEQLLPLVSVPRSSLSVRKLKRVDQRVDQFWLHYRTKLGNAALRSSAFINWRYADHPIFAYQIWVVERGINLLGFAVGRWQTVSASGLKLLRLVEFMAETALAEKVLLGRIVAEARAADASLIDFFCASAQCLAPFTAVGFVTAPAANQFTRLFDPVDLTRPSFGTISFNGGNIHGRLDATLFNQKENWYVTSGDGDSDRPNHTPPAIV